MTLLTGDPNAQRLWSDAEAQTFPRPSWLSALQNIGKQQLGQPEIQQTLLGIVDIIGFNRG